MTIWIPFVLILIATGFDLWNDREIPDTISVLLLLWAIGSKTMGWTEITWLSMTVGVGVGFVLGALLFWMGGLGGGDVKLVAALGACLGISALLTTLFWMAIAGGVLSLIMALRGKDEFAYVPAIAMGLAATLVSNGELSRVLGT